MRLPKELLKKMGKGKKIVFACLYICFLITVILGFMRFLSFHGVSSGWSVKVMYSGNEDRNSWSGRYRSFSGERKKYIYVDSGAVSIDIITESGEIAVTVTDENDEILFSAENMETSSYDINASGKLLLNIKANKHKGSFKICEGL